MTDEDKNRDMPPDAAYPLLRIVRKWVDRVTLGLNVVGTLLIVAIMLLVNADVFGRSLANAPVSGVPELVSMSIVAIVFLQVAQTFRKGRLNRTEALLAIVARRSPRIRAGMELLFAAVAGAIMWAVMAASWPLFVKSWERNTFEGTIGDFTAPIWPVKLVILIGCAALIVQLALHAIAAFFEMITGRPHHSGWWTPEGIAYREQRDPPGGGRDGTG